MAVRRMGDHAIRRAEIADADGQRARIDAADTNQIICLQPRVEMFLGTPIRRIGYRGAQHQSACRRFDGLDVFGIRADIADMRKGDCDDLPGIAGVRQDFLIAGHRCVETDFAGGIARSAEAITPKYRTIRKNQNARSIRRCRCRRRDTRSLVQRRGHFPRFCSGARFGYKRV